MSSLPSHPRTKHQEIKYKHYLLEVLNLWKQKIKLLTSLYKYIRANTYIKYNDLWELHKNLHKVLAYGSNKIKDIMSVVYTDEYDRKFYMHKEERYYFRDSSSGEYLGANNDNIKKFNENLELLAQIDITTKEYDDKTKINIELYTIMIHMYSPCQLQGKTISETRLYNIVHEEVSKAAAEEEARAKRSLKNLLYLKRSKVYIRRFSGNK